MENKNKTIEDFFSNKFDRSNKVLLDLRVEYDKEMSAPGCTNCRKRALRNKYTKLIEDKMFKNE